MRSLAPGSTISHYRISELIANGGMGEVYKAVDTTLGRIVAIKIPTAAVIEDAKGQAALSPRSARRFASSASKHLYNL